MSMWTKLKLRKQLIDSFKAAGIYLGNEERRIYPQIHSVSTNEHSTIISFSMPTGLNPDLLKKHYYVFQQKFGKKIEIEGEIKHFKLSIHNRTFPAVLQYDYSHYQQYFRKAAIPIVAGQDSAGNTIVYDMVENPHLLIAGETGSGKSTQLRSVLSTLIQALPADQLELFLCDLKRSEFHLFRRIEHVRGVYVSPEEMLPILLYLQREMKCRGDLLDKYEVAHIDDLPIKLSYIVLCIDEVALLQDQPKIMKLVEEISAIGRALGVFLILSMQRPDSKVLDGKLKNNLTVRMGFKCADLINSRIIGTPGSEKLTNKGRMLLKLPGLTDLQEIQAPYLDLQKAKELLEPYRISKPNNKQNPPSKASPDVIDLTENKNGIFEVLDE